MLEKPDLPDQAILACLQREFGLQVEEFSFLPIGADLNTAVFRVDAVGREVYFLKLRKGDFNEIAVQVHRLLSSAGISAVIPPIPTRVGQLWARLGEYAVVLSPFIQGKDGYEVKLSERQWVDFGSALRAVHTVRVPSELAERIPGEDYSARERDRVRRFQQLVENQEFTDPEAREMARVMRREREVIDQAVGRAEELAAVLRLRWREYVLCHADIHPGNLLLPDETSLYIVDWDSPNFAPPERDLILIGGCATWNNPAEIASFYQGYGSYEVDWAAMAYFRYERMIADFSAFGQQLLLSTDGGADRVQGLAWFKSNFLPGHELELAREADGMLTSNAGKSLPQTFSKSGKG